MLSSELIQMRNMRIRKLIGDVVLLKGMDNPFLEFYDTLYLYDDQFLAELEFELRKEVGVPLGWPVL